LVEVSALFSRKAIAQSRQDSISELRDLVGLTETELADPKTMMSVEKHWLLFERLAEAERPDISFHMRTSASMRCDDFGTLGMAMKSAPTLLQSLNRLERYTRIYNQYSSFSQFGRGDEYWWVNAAYGPRRDGRFLSDQAALGTFMALWRDACGESLKPKRVQFSHSPIGSVEPLESHFQCAVIFDAESDAIVLDRADLERRNTVGDMQIWKFIRQHLAQSIEATQPNQIDREVVIHVANSLSDGVPRLDDVASSLGLGGRTLQRRLSELGHSYQSLVEEARREVAMKLVADPRHSLVEIAFLTGFAEQSSFTRAFKKWSGQTPRAYRGNSRISLVN
jgi:AraC-like DNA-binding protein